MRPIRALAVICLLAAAWLVARIPTMRAEIERFRAAVHPRPDAPRPSQLEWSRPSPLIASVAPKLDMTVVPVAKRATLPPSPAAPAPVGPRAETDRLAAPLSPVPKALASVDPHAIATRAYALLAAGDRRAAAAAFQAALVQGGDADHAPAWRAQLALMTKRWSGSAYLLVRGSEPAGLATRPELGGGQAGAQLRYMIDPLARRPIALVGRIAAATDGRSIGRDSAQAALGVDWQPLPDLPIALSAERLIALGSAARAAWTVRLAGGIDHPRPPDAAHWLDVGAYAEAGVVGARRRDLYASAIARAGLGTDLAKDLTLVSGVGAWASGQHTGATLYRIDIGPSARLRWTAPPIPIDLTLDWRVRIAGDARPDSGPALTLSTQF